MAGVERQEFYQAMYRVKGKEGLYVANIRRKDIDAK
jgi:hypothetical protein